MTRKVNKGESATFVEWGSRPSNGNLKAELVDRNAAVHDLGQVTESERYRSFVLPSIYTNEDFLPGIVRLTDDGVVRYKKTVELSGVSATSTSEPVRDNSRQYDSPGETEGYDTEIVLNHDSDSSSIPDSFIIKVKNLAGSLVKSLAFNESGLLRLWTVRKEEPAIVMHTFSNATTSSAFELRGPVADGAPLKYAVSGQGFPLLGANQIIGAHVVVLDTAEAVPVGLPAGTVILRRSS